MNRPLAATPSLRSIHRSDFPSIDDLPPIEAVERSQDDGSDLSLDFSRKSEDDNVNEHVDSQGMVNVNGKINQVGTQQRNEQQAVEGRGTRNPRNRGVENI